MVIFDLDGTLTVPVLDFDLMRAEMGIASGPILEALDRMDAAERERAEHVLHRHEEAAATGSVLRPGATDCLESLRSGGWPVAILTRNARRWTQVVLERHRLTVDACWTRDDGEVKPSPHAILELCRRCGREPVRSWMVGDHLFDIQCGRAAGCRTVLVVDDETPPYAEQADHVIRELETLVELIAGK
jgi:HAD superfamily hydrolase (TIGR01549 family)